MRRYNIKGRGPRDETHVYFDKAGGKSRYDIMRDLFSPEGGQTRTAMSSVNASLLRLGHPLKSARSCSTTEML